MHQQVYLSASDSILKIVTQWVARTGHYQNICVKSAGVFRHLTQLVSVLGYILVSLALE